MTNHKFIGWGFVAAIFLLATAAYAQTNVFEYSTNLSINDQVSEDKVNSLMPDPELVPLDKTLTEPDAGSVHALSFVGFGVNRALTQLIATDPNNPIELSYALATSTWWDNVTISDPLLDGTQGTFAVTMLVNGAGTFTASSAWLSSPDVDVYGQWLSKIITSSDELGWQENYWYGAWSPNETGDGLDYTGDPLNTFQQEATFSFIYGKPFALGGLLQTYLSLDNFISFVPGTMDATLDLGHSAYWGGMTAIRDANGHVVHEVSLKSKSGIDWRKPIGKAVRVKTRVAVGKATVTVGKSVRLRAKLRSYPGAVAVTGKALTFKLDGKKIGTAMTMANGSAALRYASPVGSMAGDRTVTVVFAGDSDYDASRDTGTLTVKYNTLTP